MQTSGNAVRPVFMSLALGTIVAKMVTESTRCSAGSLSFAGPVTEVVIYENTYRRRWFTIQ